MRANAITITLLIILGNILKISIKRISTFDLKIIRRKTKFMVSNTKLTIPLNIKNKLRCAVSSEIVHQGWTKQRRHQNKSRTD